MKNKLLLILFFAVFTLSITMLMSCSFRKKSPEAATKFLKELKSYTCNVELKIKNDKQTLSYDLKQYYKKGTGYRLELGQDRIMIYKEDKIYINDRKSNFKYTTDKNFDKLYKLSFVGEYIGLLYTNEEIKYKNMKVEGNEHLLIELLIPGGNKNLNKAVLYINAKTNLPYKLFIYDEKGNEKVEAIYKDFLPNEEISEDLFNIN